MAKKHIEVAIARRLHNVAAYNGSTEFYHGIEILLQSVPNDGKLQQDKDIICLRPC
mgnify:CR=1 FL=1